jgi:hypothetical protein
MLVLPEMVGSMIGVHQGKGWIQVEVKVCRALGPIRLCVCVWSVSVGVGLFSFVACSAETTVPVLFFVNERECLSGPVAPFFYLPPHQTVMDS